MPERSIGVIDEEALHQIQGLLLRCFALSNTCNMPLVLSYIGFSGFFQQGEIFDW